MKRKKARRYFGYCHRHKMDLDRRGIEIHSCLEKGCQHLEQTPDQYQRSTGKRQFIRWER